MSQFWDNAHRLLDAALNAARAGARTDSMTVVVGVEGGIHLIPNSDWPLDRLASDRGAAMVYRVTQERGRIEVEGRSATDRCHLETASPARPLHALLRDEPRYTL